MTQEGTTGLLNEQTLVLKLPEPNLGDVTDHIAPQGYTRTPWAAAVTAETLKINSASRSSSAGYGW
jgi:hypothetical protein